MPLRLQKDPRGSITLVFALSVLTLLGFVVLGYEVGTWYLVQGELSKAVDFAAIAAAANVSNPYVNVTDLCTQFAKENFAPGFMGTPKSGARAANFTCTALAEGRFDVTGTVSAAAGFSKSFGVKSVPTKAAGSAQKRKVEVILVLDRSHSMAGEIGDLRTAALNFVKFFGEDPHQDAENKMGLITFNHSALVKWKLQTGSYSSMTSIIQNLQADGQTNTEDAIDLAGREDLGGFKNQSGLPGDERIAQFLIVFSDGLPTCFRDSFLYQGTSRDGVLCMYNTDCPVGASPGLYDTLRDPNNQSGFYGVSTGIPTYYLGDGLPYSQSQCKCNCHSVWDWSKWKFITVCDGDTVKWDSLFGTPVFPAPGACCLEEDDSFNGQDDYLGYEGCILARQMSKTNATNLKTNYGVKIYTVCLGEEDTNCGFMSKLASDDSFAFATNDPSELNDLFSDIAKQIKLRLVH